MKSLNSYINSYIKDIYVTEGIFKNIGADVVTVKTKDELIKLINETTKKEGWKCDLNFIDVSKIKDMTHVFCQSEFNGDISRWDVSNVRVMDGMFLDSDFNGDISKWDVSNVRSMHFMFGTSKFTGDISK